MNFIDRLGEYQFRLYRKGFDPASIRLSEKNAVKLETAIQNNRMYLIPGENDIPKDVYGLKFFGMIIKQFKTAHKMTGSEKYELWCEERAKG